MLTKVPPPGDSFFAGIVPQKVSILSHGRPTEFELPQRYYEWSLMLGHFPASAAAIRRLLPEHSGLEPVTIAPGLGVVTLGAFDYKRCATLGPYSEVGVMFPVRLRPALPLPAVPLFRPEWFSDLGFYIWQLPVTTEEAKDAGCRLWNFPKTVGRISFEEKKPLRRLICRWEYEGAHVLTLEIRTSNTTRQLRNFLAYSVLGGRLQQTLVQSYGDYDESRFGFDATFALGEHMIADQMRELGMIDVALGRLYGTGLEGILPGPSPVPFSTAPSLLQAPRVLRSIVSREAARRPGKTVAVLGGGVAGLSAAHELAERGFDVTVYEPREVPGGKARSMGVPDSAPESRADLPCEHGFRFFPGFYRHLPDTMARIPYEPTGKTVADNLVATSRIAIDFQGDRQLVFPARFPTTLGDLATLLSGAALVQQRTGCTAAQISTYINKIWQLLTSCEERRLEQYEDISWWEFIEGGQHGDEYDRYLASTTRTLVAADPKKASTRTVGNVLLQMLFDFATPGVSVDRVLNGPTNEVWIDPWVEHLKSLGVKFEVGKAVELHIHEEHRSVTGVAAVVKRHGRNEPTPVKADYYVAAMPVEAMANLVHASPAVLRADPALEKIVKLSHDVESMTGIQFYFREPLPLEAGHYMHLDTPWALTSLAQAQFWTTDLARYGDGTIRDILSVDVSDWNVRGVHGGPAGGKTANQCSRAEIKREVWAQLVRSLPALKDLEPATVFLDDAVTEVPPLPDGTRIKNDEPLLVNKAKKWKERLEATTGIVNLFLAADYVRTYTDLATMEGANEAARRAVNAILAASRSTAAPCPVWNLHEPAVLAPWRWVDRLRYRLGLPWNADFPLALRALELGLSVVNVAATTLVGLATAPPEAELSPDEHEAIGDRLQDFIDGMHRGDRELIRSLFLRRATITIGVRQGTVEQLIPYVREGIVVRIEDFKSIYRLGPRVHLRMAVRVSDERHPARRALEGHVHVVLVRPGDNGGAPIEAQPWRIASLRYRREGRPAHLEPLAAE